MMFADERRMMPLTKYRARHYWLGTFGWILWPRYSKVRLDQSGLPVTHSCLVIAPSLAPE
jgi:hypothetical protein